ncbi:MAG: DUF4230 domain-containing protein [Trichococcus sp.]|uniref:DUF4230 domain-containing protein n=1 Tax=Trichococcus sp. TaxID=1985464 RepID=UPI003C4FC58E
MKKILLLLVIGLAGYFIFTETDLISTRTNRSSETALVQEKLVELSEWTTLKYEYSNVIISRTDKSFELFGFGDLDFDYAEAIKLIEYSGYLKAGTDLSKLQITYNEETKQLLVRVPKSQILDNVVETEKTRVEDIKGNIFSDYPSQVIFDEINVNKQQLEEEKISQGFLDEADNRIEVLLTSFLSTNGFEDAVIEFEFY